MKSWISFAIVAVNIFALTDSVLPDDYALEIMPTCTDTGASIFIVSDFYLEIHRDCAGNFTDVTSTGSSPFASLDAYYGDPSTDDTSCFFYEIAEGAYAIYITIYWSVFETNLRTENEIYTITCTAGNVGVDETSQSSISDSLYTPKLLLDSEREVTTTNVSLQLVDFRGKEFDGGAHAGKLVRLRAETAEPNGLYPLQCLAFDSTLNQEYEILRAGCGDGLVLNRESGFTSTGTTALSDPFRLFHLKGGNQIQFTCEFVVCNGTCNGHSCDL